MLIILWLFGIWRKSERWNSSVSGCLMSWPQIVVLKCHLFLFYTTVIHFSIRLQCVTKSGFYMATSSVVGLRRSSKALPKAKLAPKKTQKTAAVCWSAAWSDPLWLFESRQNHYIWEECSVNQKDAPKNPMPAAGISQQKGPNSSPWQQATMHGFKSWMIWATKFCLICHIDLTSCQYTITSTSISTTFCRENVSTSSRMKIMLSKSLLNPNAQIFFVAGMNFFSLAKLCWL